MTFHLLSIIRGKHPEANGQDLTASGIDVSPEDVDWLHENGYGTDPDLWVLVTRPGMKTGVPAVDVLASRTVKT